jgi:cytochrome b6-f complex iron-sulfur subunit
MRVVAELSTGVIAALGVMVAVIAIALIVGLSSSRQMREARAGEREPSAKPVKAVSRRDFFRGSLITSLLVFGAEFGAGTIAFLWPNLRGGFGSKISAGSLNDIKGQLSGGEPVYNGQGRFYIVAWNGTPGTGQADYPALGVTAEGIMPLYQRCVHLGCRVPFCDSSKWFECPCHGSKYSGVGEYKLGPAPRGMDRFVIEISGDDVTVDTSSIVLGPPKGTDTTGQPQQGPFCVPPA